MLNSSLSLLLNIQPERGHHGVSLVEERGSIALGRVDDDIHVGRENGVPEESASDEGFYGDAVGKRETKEPMKNTSGGTLNQ